MMKKGGMVFAAVVMVGVLALNSLAAPADDAKVAAEKPEKLAAMLEGKSEAEATGIITEAVKAAIELGGDERTIKRRLATLAGAAIPAARGNAAAVATAMVKAGGEKYLAVIVASIAKSAEIVKAAPSVLAAAVGAAGDDNAKAAKDAADNPAQTLGGLTARQVGRVAAYVQSLVTPPTAPKVKVATTVATATKTVTTDSKLPTLTGRPLPVTPVGLQ